MDAVVTAAAANLSSPPSVDEMARIACLSKYHFVRVFHEVTGLTPARFVTALRLREASRLLLLSEMAVMDVGTAVGYSSAATFTNQYRRYTGFAPRDLRRLASSASQDELRGMISVAMRAMPGRSEDRGTVSGTVTVPARFSGIVVIGLFPARLASGLPLMCTACRGSGPFRLEPVPDGHYWLMAIGLPSSADVSSCLTPVPETLLVGAAPVRAAGSTSAPADLTLRWARPSDPPVLSPLPALLLTRR
ncbi:helix-turn-helix domain-containing protein [Amycolatopsis silviterrae]|uniref:Helix-turn-helix domain-containing protein n=1 Tax=Amycolatopsis silviterrae TaxID=1656914 RepID=A0ABW5HGE3_9PSEU